MSADSDSRLLDSIYAAAWDPGALQDALRDLACLSRSRSAGLFRLRDGVLDWNETYNMPAEFMPDFSARIVPSDPRIVYALQQPPLTVLRDDIPELQPAIRAAGVDRFAREYDLPYTVACALDPPGRDGTTALFISRSGREGRPDTAQLDAFARYMPHFARAFSLRRQIRADLDAGVSTLTRDDETRQGALGVDRFGRVRWLDSGAEYLLAHNDGVALIGGRLRFVDAATASGFDRLLHALITARPLAGVSQIDVPQTPPAGFLNLRLLPNCAGSADERAAPVRVLLQRRVTAAANAGLAPTRRQHEVLQLLALGLPSKQIGRLLGITENTVRNHIQSLLRLLQASTRGACVARAREWGWLD